MKKKIISFLVVAIFVFAAEFISPSSKIFAQLGCGTWKGPCCTGSFSSPCEFGMSCQGGICEQNATTGNSSSGGSSGSDILCESDDKAINTALGCIKVLNNDGGTAFMAFVLRWAVGVGGGIAFLLILYAGFMLMTSTGNPERIKAGQELLTSAISGLILLIFSVFILKFIGIDILGLCKFGFGNCPP
jgi:hypothetical protein